MPVRVMVLSDVVSYQGLPGTVEGVRPDYVVVAGDVLYDGRGQVYLDEGGGLVSGNTHEDERLLRLHLGSLRGFLQEALDCCVERVFLLYGDHDLEEGVDFSRLIESWGLDSRRVVDVVRPMSVDLGGVSLLLIPYTESYEGLRETLESIRNELRDAGILVTHLELYKLRALVGRVKAYRSRPVLVVSGHEGYGYYPPGEAWRNLVADPLRIHYLALNRLPPGKVDLGRLRSLSRSIEEEEMRKHRWLVEDRLVHLARIDESPRSFLALVKEASLVRGSLYFLERRPGASRGRLFCNVRDSRLKPPEPLSKIPYHRGGAYRVCEFTVQL